MGVIRVWFTGKWRHGFAPNGPGPARLASGLGTLPVRSGIATRAPDEQLSPSNSLAITRSRAKRLTDAVGALTLLIVLAPVFAVVAVAIAVDSGSPVLSAQKRIAVDRRRGVRRDPRGRTFKCWKFRTMVADAERIREKYRHLSTAPFPAFKIRGDPRITRVGRFLRRSSLDELPQLWNVLRGEMSMVGPRPPLPEEAAHYDDFALQRLAVRPGITCLWQLDRRHRAGSTFHEWVEKDLEYIRGWSLSKDLVLIGRTAIAVLRMTGD